MKRFLSLLALLLLGMPALSHGEVKTVPPWFADFYGHHKLVSGIVYQRVGNRDLKLDIYQRNNIAGPAPTFFYVHGGAWEHGSTISEMGHMMPWLALGWTVVSIEYRLSGEAPAPAAVVDCRSALHWLVRNADKYGIDLDHLIIGGASAGGNLALVMAMAPPSAEFDGKEIGQPLPKPVAIINLSGVVDVEDILRGPNARPFAAAWIGTGPGSDALAKRVSPITYVRPGLPPFFSSQGDLDPTVPHSQTIRFHEALTAAGVPNQLWNVVGGGHGSYTHEQYLGIYRNLCEFLDKYHLNAEK